MKETEFKLKVLNYIKLNYKDIWIQKISDNFTAGIPDIIGCYKGIFFAIELKVNYNKPTSLQSYVGKLIRKSGGIAICLYPKTFYKLKQIFDNIEQNMPIDSEILL